LGSGFFSSISMVVDILHKGVDTYRPLVYIYGMQKAVTIRVRKGTRDRLNAVKNPGQTLDGIITQLIDLWEKVKKQED